MAGVVHARPWAGSVRALRQVSQFALLALAPAALTIAVLVAAVHQQYAFDFHGSVWQAARDVLDRHNPYPPATRAGVAPGNRFVYPPPVAIVALPLGVLPFPVAAAVFTVVLLAALGAALAILGVRDWRCYGAAYLSIAVIHDVRLGAITPLLALGLALLWRWRDEVKASVALAAVVVAKLFLWPIAVWLLATGRWRVTARAAAIALAVTAASWAAIGFAGLTSYPALLRVLTDVEEGRGYSVVAGGLWLGAPAGLARILAVIIGATLLALCWREGRRRHDERSLMIAVAAALALSPIVWLHYFVLLLVPIALAWRAFSPVWLVPTLFWITPYEEHFGEHWRIGAGLTIAGFALGASARSNIGRRRGSLITAS
jgi:Glycosyltransferase family 87